MPQIKQFKLPDVGEGLTEGEILQWLVDVGDTVTVNQPIVEVETAKAAVELPCPFAGVVTELMYDAGSTVDVGAPIIAIDTEPDGTARTEVEREAVAESGPPPSADTLSEVHVAAEEEAIEPGMIGGPAPGGRTSVLVGYGPRTVEAKRRPRVQPGHPAPQAADYGSGTDKPPLAAPLPEAPPSAPPTQRPAAAAPPSAPPTQPPAAVEPVSTDRPLAKPPVRKYAKSLGVDLATVHGSGPNGSVTRDDVEQARGGEVPQAEPAQGVTPQGEPAQGVAPQVAPVFDASREQRIPIKGVRKHTAAAMVASAFTAPHVTEWVTIDVTPMMKLRDRVAAQRDFRDLRVSPLVLVAKALLLAVAKYPMINSSWDEQAQEIVVKDYVNLGIAAATPRGLIVPNIKDAGRLSLPALTEALGRLTETARAGRTAPEDMSGGTLTITNVGVFGVDTGTPILNPGESAILAFGAIRKQPWVHKGKIKPRLITQLGLSFDHRVVDGELGSRFLADLGSVLADPRMALTF